MKYFPSAPLAAFALALTSIAGHGAVLYSGLKNITVSNGFTSVYVDVDGFSSSPTQGTGWDIEAFFGGEAIGNSASFEPVRQTVAIDSAIVRLNLGEIVNGSDVYASGEAGSADHIGNASNQFASGVEGYFGFRLIDNSAAGPFFGWMRVNLSDTGTTGTIIDWAYDNSGAAISVGAVPEPTACVLVSLGCVMFAFRRRRP